MRTLLSADDIQNRVVELGQEITEQYRDRREPLLLIGVLTGSIIFLADLIRQITVPHQVGMVVASSYRGKTTQPAELRVQTDFLPELSGRNVLLVDDIFDTGNTISSLYCELKTLSPASLQTAVLLRKKGCSQVDFTPDFVAFEIENEFVIGYGLDYDNDYRHLPEICVLEDVDLA